jgi:transcriptional regulator with XRE-family HTH domain
MVTSGIPDGGAMTRVGDEIKRLRKDRGWSQPQLAVKAGIAVSAVSQIENGRRSPNVSTLDKLAGAFGVEVMELFPKTERRSSLEPSLFNSLGCERQAGYEALAAWAEYLGLTLTRWEKLRRQFQDLANRNPDEERDSDDLYHALTDSLEFFRAVDRFHVVVGGFDVPRFEAAATDVESREMVYLVSERAEKLGRITDLFLEYNQRLSEALEARQSAWARQEVEKFLEDVMKEEARTADVS